MPQDGRTSDRAGHSRKLGRAIPRLDRSSAQRGKGFIEGTRIRSSQEMTAFRRAMGLLQTGRLGLPWITCSMLPILHTTTPPCGCSPDPPSFGLELVVAPALQPGRGY